ncbi:hypothetical protein F4692_000876 [Nocardioides cavernae]|uniref:Uncharacterized protein n=1 Tax=Nocardioides cavernae TaxID=1921566 RepID=A0A7Y9KRV9_9ACTN|nr:hypothetical protein [Nocardioides cavernae]NYE35772.1 hypothetical protein [Nocardioides cavernae]
MKLDTDVLDMTRTSRRTVVRGAAWSVPVIAAATAAPAFAASPCDPRTGAVIDWDNTATTTHQRTSILGATTKYDPDGNGPVPVLTLTTTAVYSGNMKSGTEFGNAVNDSLLLQSNVGNLGAGLVMYQSTTSTGAGTFNDRGTYTFQFSRPVKNLTFTVTDIDSNGSQYYDAVSLTPGFTQQFRATALTGAGTDTDPYRASSATAPVDDFTSQSGNVRVSYANEISSFSITYWNRSANLGNTSGALNNQQAIFLSNLTFDYDPC